MQKCTPKVSIIICNYNYGRMLSDAIESTLAQDYPFVETIVVDDGSTDNSREVIARYPTVKAIFKVNGGQTSAVRAGLERASGDIILILDSDDMLKPQACSTIAKHWCADLSLLQFRLEKQNLERKVVGYYPDQSFLYGDEKEFVLKYGYIPSSPTSGNAFSRQHIIESFKYNLDRDRACVDGYLIFTAPLVGRVLSLDEILGIYRVHDANFTGGRNNLRRLKNYIVLNLDHCSGLAQRAKMLSLSNKRPRDYLNPYCWRAILLLKKGYPREPEATDYTTFEIVRKGISAFLRFPRISIRRRCANVATLLALATGPSALARLFVSIR
jgi:glycosyltransferase involved in cell wall biosynthesis